MSAMRSWAKPWLFASASRPERSSLSICCRRAFDAWCSWAVAAPASTGAAAVSMAVWRASVSAETIVGMVFCATVSTAELTLR
jgi:hypothetical protein